MNAVATFTIMNHSGSGYAENDSIELVQSRGTGSDKCLQLMITSTAGPITLTTPGTGSGYPDPVAGTTTTVTGKRNWIKSFVHGFWQEQ